MSKKWLVIPAVLISLCIGLGTFHGVEMDGPESIIEHHKVVSVMDDGRYLMESPDGELYLYGGDLQGVEPGDYIVIQRRTEGSAFSDALYIILGIVSLYLLFELILLALSAHDSREE